MANFAAADVKKLRDATGAGMMDSKRALEEADGDFDKAVELLRIKGAKSLGKRAERTAGNGLVASVDGAMIELNCETDFVAKNDQFQVLAQDIATAAAKARPADRDALAALQLPDGQSVQAGIDALAAVIGEKLLLGRVAVFDGPTTVYLHRRSSDLPPQVGVLVAYSSTSTDADASPVDSAEAAARATAMQIAAMRPQYVSRDDVPPDIVDNERRIAEATAREEGKPEAALTKIVDGRVTGFFKQVALLEQSSVQDQKKTVQQALAEAAISVRGFARFEVGEA
ncbi:MAG TPA: translation elongation factor Ts [Actinomycetes bacterium]|nr:translation elongation factor Ts [Actinomycetes bacterium]